MVTVWGTVNRYYSSALQGGILSHSIEDSITGETFTEKIMVETIWCQQRTLTERMWLSDDHRTARDRQTEISWAERLVAWSLLRCPGRSLMSGRSFVLHKELCCGSPLHDVASRRGIRELLPPDSTPGARLCGSLAGFTRRSASLADKLGRQRASVGSLSCQAQTDGSRNESFAYLAVFCVPDDSTAQATRADSICLRIWQMLDRLTSQAQASSVSWGDACLASGTGCDRRQITRPTRLLLCPKLRLESRHENWDDR